VDGVAWPLVDRLADLGPADRGFIARQADDGTVSVQFGDGLQGQRLPSGTMNVRARYRVGIGLAGNVAAGQISQLRARALGVKAVTNPLPAAGAADPEARDEARRNAPLAVRTLDRIVSLRDFEDFASAYAGIGKAQAGWLWDGEGRLVQLTVSGVDGQAIAPLSALALNLRAAVDAVRPAHQALVIAPALVLRFGLTAGVRVLPGFEVPVVLAAVRSALADAFGFAQRSFAQSLAASQVLDVMQHTAGVDWIDLDELRLRDDTPTQTQLATERGPDARLRARGARWADGAVQPAQLLLIAPGDILLTEITALPEGMAA
jgi:predicted phage baseplate assembly protein